jgi:hypothetical protein
MLRCIHCGRKLRVENFCRDFRSSTGRSSSCRDCTRQRDQLRYLATKRKREGGQA